MEPNLNHHSPIRSNPIPDKSNFTPCIVNAKSNVVYFLEDLYTYPPKIKIQWKKLDQGLPNKFIHNTPHTPFRGVRDFTDKVISSDLYKNKTKVLKRALKDIPVYVVVNGLNEMVVAKTKPHHVNLASNSSGKGIRITEKALSTESRKLGFIFFDLDEAELYKNTLIQSSERAEHSKRDSGIKKVGLCVSCIGLNTAYDMVVRSTSRLGFYFVPSLDGIKLEIGTPMIGENEKLLARHEEHLRKKKIKGVPIYIMKVRKIKESILDGPNIVPVKDFKYFSESSPNNETTYVLFEKEQAIERAQEFNNSPGVRCDEIYSHNLEDFLESWEESLLKDTHTSTFSIKREQPIYFIPSKKSIKTLKEYYNRPKDSLGKSIKVWGRRKLDKLFWFQKNYLGLILRGYRI
mmetsp:Transcript_4651/g.9067  ORF Transcript_4651/g.9067 Transcript_4651/m.9067 type:complete len:404 (+) Transcript_4651:81-1292(+)